MTNIAVVVHGGAWAIPDHLAASSRAGVKKAASEAYQILLAGGFAVDAVEAAVRILEDDPAFDAGTGSVLNMNGEVEMDALIMDGRGLRSGGVSCVQNIAHPISLARLVMDKTEHTLLVGQGANMFAAEMGIPTVLPESLVTDEARAEFAQFCSYNKSVAELFHADNIEIKDNPTDMKENSKSTNGGVNTSGCHDTVGCVARDSYGNVACATSTGGITAKRPGRVGDSPVIGAGGYADNEVGAVSSTGHGESISKVCLAQRVITNMRQGFDAVAASAEALHFMSRRVYGHGGVIVVTKDGEICHNFTTQRMAWAAICSGMLQHGLEQGETIVEKLT